MIRDAAGFDIHVGDEVMYKDHAYTVINLNPFAIAQEGGDPVSVHPVQVINKGRKHQVPEPPPEDACMLAEETYAPASPMINPLPQPVLKFTNGDRPRLELLPTLPLKVVAAGFAAGLEKYPRPYSWRGGVDYMSLVGATLRHIFAWVEGEECAQDTSVHHLGHAICNLMMILDQSMCNDTSADVDNRPLETVDDATRKSYCGL